jgi:hypothetical protein
LLCRGLIRNFLCEVAGSSSSQGAVVHEFSFGSEPHSAVVARAANNTETDAETLSSPRSRRWSSSGTCYASRFQHLRVRAPAGMRFQTDTRELARILEPRRSRSPPSRSQSSSATPATRTPLTGQAHADNGGSGYGLCLRSAVNQWSSYSLPRAKQAGRPAALFRAGGRHRSCDQVSGGGCPHRQNAAVRLTSRAGGLRQMRKFVRRLRHRTGETTDGV